MTHPVHVMFEDIIAFMIALFFIPMVIIGEHLYVISLEALYS